MKTLFKTIILNCLFRLIYFGCLLNCPKLVSLFIRVSLRRIKSIVNKKNGKKFLVLHKANGTEEIINAYKKKKSKNIYYELKRNSLKTICNYFIKDLIDYNYKSYLKEHDENKTNYRLFLEKVFSDIKSKEKIHGIINFNIFYKSDFELAKVCNKLGIRLITFHKEGVSTPNQSINLTKVYKDLNDKYLGFKIGVTNLEEKKRIVKSKICSSDKIYLIGSPKINYFYKLSKTNTLNKKISIVFFQYTKKRGNFRRTTKPKNIYKDYRKRDYGWDDTETKCIKSLIAICNKFKDEVEVTFKIRENTWIKPHIFKHINIPENFKIVSSASSFWHLKKSDVVLSYNSSTLIEGLAAKKIVIMPVFSKKIDWNKSLDVKRAVKVITNQKVFEKYIKEIINSKINHIDFYKNQKVIKARNHVIDKYFFNSDGKADKRMVNFLEKNI